MCVGKLMCVLVFILCASQSTGRMFRASKLSLFVMRTCFSELRDDVRHSGKVRCMCVFVKSIVEYVRTC